MNNPANGKFAIFEEAPGGGDVQSPTALRHRPLNDPMNWLPNIFFHSDFNYYGVVAKNLGKLVSHAAVPGATTNVGGTGLIVVGQEVARTISLLTHNLGYIPLFFVAIGNQMFAHGTPVQIQDGGQRYVTAYATNTEIVLREVGFSTANPLPAVNLTYQVIVFRNVAADPSLPLVELGPARAIFGRGKFQIAQAHLRQVASGESPFSIQQGVSAAILNGGIGIRKPDGSTAFIGGFNGAVPSPDVINVGI